MTQNDRQFVKRWISSIGITALLLAASTFLPMNFSTKNNIDIPKTTAINMKKDISLVTIPKRKIVKSVPKEIVPTHKEKTHAPKKIVNKTETIPTKKEQKQTEEIANKEIITEEAITEKVETQEIVEQKITEEEIVHEQIESQATENYDTDIDAEQFIGKATTTATSAPNISPASNDVSQKAIAKYKQYAVSRIASNKSYPLASRAKSEEGAVRVFVVIGRDGSLRDAIITKACDFSTLNEAALRAVKKSAPFEKLGKEIDAETVSFECVMEFRIEI